jgi:hypothetical protein
MDRPRSALGQGAGHRLTAGQGAGHRLTAGRLAPLLCATALASIMLAACGSSQASGGASGASPSPTVASTVTGSPAAASPGASPGATATQAALCRDAASVTGLKIVRDQVARVPELQITFPNQVTVASPARARAVARALCALPAMPRGVFDCPALLIGTTYLLRFAAGGRQLAAVTIEATGCQVVTGVGPVRWAATSPGFWRVLGTAAHLRPPGRSAFSGDGHPGLSCDPSREQANGCPALIQPGAVAVP